MFAFEAILHALPDAAAIGALIAIFVDRKIIRIFGRTIRGNKLLGLAVFSLLLVMLTGRSIYENYKHRDHIADVERNIAFLIAGNPLTIEQIEDYAFKSNLDDIEEALVHMVSQGSVRLSKQDAMVMSQSNYPVKIRVFSLSSK